MKNNVLIVEDEAIVALEIRENIEKLGHTVVDVTDTAEGAVRLAVSKKPDLVIMDVRLKGDMDGVEAAALIRRSADVPVIFLTAYSGDETLQRAMLAEPYSYLLKPVQEQQLASAIRIASYKHGKDSMRREGARGLSAILRALSNGIVVTDTYLNVKFLNAKAEEITGLSLKEANGKPLGEIIPLEELGLDSDSLESFDDVLGEGRSIALGERMISRRDGVRTPVQIEISGLRDRANLIVGSVVNVVDLSTTTTNLERARQDALQIGGADPIIREKGDLRTFLEVELVRLTMNDSSEDAAGKAFREGQMIECKRILRLMFGDEALEEIEGVLPG